MDVRRGARGGSATFDGGSRSGGHLANARRTPPEMPCGPSWTIADGRSSRILPVARDALRTALGNVPLENDEDGISAVFEDTADRLLLRAVGGERGLVAGVGFEPTTFGL